MKELGEGLDDLALAEKFCRSPLPDERDRRVTPSKRKTNSKSFNGLAEFHLDDWIKLKIETKASRLLFALRQKWQVNIKFEKKKRIFRQNFINDPRLGTFCSKDARSC